MSAIPTSRAMPFLLLLAACVADPESEPEDDAPELDNPRPADAPDVVVLSVSGRCGFLSNCAGSQWNEEYLDATGTVDAFAGALRARGFTVETGSAIDDWYNWVDEDDDVLAVGFLGLLESIYWLNENWIADYDNPTRLVVVAHSHGDVWAHIALHVASEVPVEVLVDLDGVSVAWEDDPGFVGDGWQDVILSSSAELGLEWPFEIWEATDFWGIPGQVGLHDIEDIVPASVDLNLEIFSDPTPAEKLAGTWDTEPNFRVDGSVRRIEECASDESHSYVYWPGADCMDWAVDEVIAKLE